MKNSKANQVATFEKLLGFCNTQGTVYNPSKASIKMAALNTLLTQAQNQMKAADTARIAYENAVNARKAGFSTLQRTASRIIDALVACGASPESVAKARDIRRTFNGHAKVLVTPASTASPDGQAQGDPVYHRRLSQLDMASKVKNFEMLIARVSEEPLYKPNEADLTVAGITSYAASLRQQNKNVIATYEAFQKANRSFNTMLYSTSGLFGVAKEAKAYVRSVFGRNSVEHKAVSMFQFNAR